MLIDASVARSIAVLGWADYLNKAMNAEVWVAHGVLAEPDEPSELSEDAQALVAFRAITGRPAMRTVDIIKLLVGRGFIDESAGRSGYRMLQEDELHRLGGPAW